MLCNALPAYEPDLKYAYRTFEPLLQMSRSGARHKNALSRIDPLNFKGGWPSTFHNTQAIALRPTVREPNLLVSCYSWVHDHDSYLFQRNSMNIEFIWSIHRWSFLYICGLAWRQSLLQHTEERCRDGCWKKLNIKPDILQAKQFCSEPATI